MKKLLIPIAATLALGAILSPSSASGGDSGGTKPPPLPPGTKPGTPPIIKPGRPAAGGAVQIDWKGDGDGLVWASTLPMGQPSPAREEAILAAVKQGFENVVFLPLEMKHASLPGHVCHLTVFARTLRIGKVNPVRVSCNYQTQQDIADYLNCAMLTPMIVNEIWKRGMRLPVTGMFNVWGSNGMGTTEHMIEYSKIIDKKVPVDYAGLVENESKHWVLASRLFSDPVKGKGWNDSAANHEPPGPWSANYGWLKPDGIPTQSVGLDHNFRHADYSQQVKLMSQTCFLNGFPVHVGQILADPKFHKLLSDEGPLSSWAHPAFGKPKLAPLPAYATNPGGVAV